MSKRFHIEKLVITGPSAQPAILNFEPGANLIIGSSDTGKSYVYQCIDFLLGAAKIPKRIDESLHYNEAYLQIRTDDNKVFTIRRFLSKPHEISYTKSIYENFEIEDKFSLGKKNDSHEGENISEFLLNLMGIKDIYVKKNVDNVKVKLSFRDIINFILVDETNIVTENSPVYTDNPYNKTKSKSVFRYLLTGLSDENLHSNESKTITKNKINGKIEFIDSLLTSKRILSNAIRLNITKEFKINIDESINNLFDKIKKSQTRIDELTSLRSAVYTELQSLKSNLLQNNEFLKRFYLLIEHYNSDISRLSFILEGEYIFSELNSKECPVCGTVLDKEHLVCLTKYQDLSQLEQSVKTEQTKIVIKLNDLKSTIDTMEKANAEIESSILRKETQLSNIDSELNLELIPLKENFESELNELIKYKEAKQELFNLNSDIENLSTQKNSFALQLSSKGISDFKFDLDFNLLKPFLSEVEKLLAKWSFPNLSSVDFDFRFEETDLIISGKERKNNGKGIRALTYSSFIFALLEYCMKNFTPHPGFIVLDSPLTTYHKNEVPKPGDEIDDNMQSAFFNYLTIVSKDRQVIILDNKIPSDEIIEKLHYVKFTKELNSERKGFIPI